MLSAHANSAVVGQNDVPVHRTGQYKTGHIGKAFNTAAS